MFICRGFSTIFSKISLGFPVCPGLNKFQKRGNSTLVFHHFKQRGMNKSEQVSLWFCLFLVFFGVGFRFFCVLGFHGTFGERAYR